MKIAKSAIFTVLLSAMTAGTAFTADYSRTGTGNWSNTVWTVDGTANQAWADGNRAVIAAANENALTLDAAASVTGLSFTGLGASDSAQLLGSQTLTFSGNSAEFSIGSGKVSTAVQFGGAFTKTGAGTLCITSNQNTFGGVTVDSGVLQINTPAGYGTLALGATPIYVNSGAKLEMLSEFSIYGSTVTLDGGEMEILATQFYLNSLVLKNGANVSARSNSGGHADGSSFRVGNNYGTGKNPELTVSGTSASTIDASVVMTAHGSSQWNVEVNSTGDASGVDLTINGQLRDYDNTNGASIKLVKTGEGTLRLANSNNIWSKGADIREGTIQLAGERSAGFSAFNLEADGQLGLLAEEAGGSGTYQITSITGNGTILPVGGKAVLQIGKVTKADGTAVQGGNFDFQSKISSGITMKKVGSGTMNLTRAGNGGAFDAFIISEGTVKISSGSANASSRYGYFDSTPVEINGTGKLIASTSWAIQGTPITVIGESAELELKTATYATTLTLTDGADVTGTDQYRVGYTSIAPTLTVTGTGTGSEVLTTQLMLVKNQNTDINYFEVKTADTGASAAGNPDLLIASKIVDHSGYEGMQIRKTGSGTLKITNQNTWQGGIQVLDGALYFAEGSLGTGALTVASGASVGTVPVNTETYIAIPTANLAKGSEIEILIDSAESFSRFTLSNNLAFADDGFLNVLVSADASVGPWNEFKISNSLPNAPAEDLDLEAWLIAEDRPLWNLSWQAGTGSLMLQMDSNAVPEPASWLLLACAALGLVSIRRKK